MRAFPTPKNSRQFQAVGKGARGESQAFSDLRARGFLRAVKECMREEKERLFPLVAGNGPRVPWEERCAYDLPVVLWGLTWEQSAKKRVRLAKQLSEDNANQPDRKSRRSNP